MSIRTRLLLLVLLATLLPAVFIGLRFVQDRAANIEAAMRSLEGAANSIATTIADKIHGTTQLHYGLARARDLEANDKAACSSFLSTVRNAYPRYTGILTITPDGQLFCDSLMTGRVLDLRDRDYFKKALVAKDGVALEPVFGRLTGISVLQIAYPARAESGLVKFVLLASLNLDALVQQYKSELPQLEIALTDTKGTVLVGKPSNRWKDLIGTSIADTGIFRFAVAHPDGGVGEVSRSEGSRQVWAVAGIPAVAAAGVHVMVGMARDDLLMVANRRLLQDLSILSGVFLVLFAGVWLLAELGIRKQIGRIALMAGELGRGDLGARIAPPYPRGELGGLMATLNSTAESLGRQRADINDLNSKLRQAQQMEAIGQLTGGLAHDFNNLLGVVIGNLDLAAERLDADPTARELVNAALDGALSGAELVKQLLAFSRRQSLEPKVVDLNERLSEMVVLLKRTLGESITIKTVPAVGLWPVLVDPTQIESAILNLSINARDAMPKGGTLTIQTDNRHLDADYAALNPDVAAGDYAMIAVSDTGTGMPPEVVARAFEPFFTTKETGKGTGLGLAMVHGFAKQSGGHASIYSEVGHGTTIRLYFPAAKSGVVAEVEAAKETGLPTGGETVLVVEDREDLRATAVAMLQRLGYRTLEAGTGAAALTILQGGAKVDLVFSDVVMPGSMSGLDLVHKMRVLGMKIPVLITSGYASPQVLRDQAQKLGLPMIGKPYGIADLAAKLRAALAGKA